MTYIENFNLKGLQEPATSLMAQLIEFHHYIVTVIIGITLVVICIIWRASNNFQYKDNTRLVFSNENKQKTSNAILLEIVWTIVPSILLIFLALPTFSTLYAFEKEYDIDTNNTFIITGNQWYWDYEYSDTFDFEDFNYLEPYDSAESVEYTSFMIATEDLKKGELRLLEADTHLIIPALSRIRFLITSSDVIHSFAVPSLGIKIDAVPGRLNQLMCVIKRSGMFYGQCSEICGIDHGFMPINLTAI